MSPAGAVRRWPSRAVRRALVILGIALVVYGAIAYLLLPSFWRHYEHQKKLDGLPMVTVTAQGIPADPINVGLVGSSSDVLCAMREAGWIPADPITLRSSLEISGSVLLDRPYPGAPVSPLYYDGRREELAFEKPVGNSADKRHHIRLWMVLKDGEENRPVWLGAVTFDRGVGFSHYTGAVTHHIAPDIDAERQLIETNLQSGRDDRGALHRRRCRSNAARTERRGGPLLHRWRGVDAAPGGRLHQARRAACCLVGSRG